MLQLTAQWCVLFVALRKTVERNRRREKTESVSTAESLFSDPKVGFLMPDDIIEHYMHSMLFMHDTFAVLSSQIIPALWVAGSP